MSTITYPRDFPSARILKVAFELDPGDTSAPEDGGRSVSVNIAFPLWQLQLSTTPPSEREFDLWGSWISSLQGGAQLFYGRDPRRPLPTRHRQGFVGMTRHGGGAFDGTSSDWDQNPAGDELEINTLPDQLTLQERDYVGFEWGVHYRSLHRVLDSFTTGGGTGVWTIEPPIPAIVPVDAVVQLVRPSCLMRITKRGDVSAQIKSRTVEFEAQQSLLDEDSE